MSKKSTKKEEEKQQQNGQSPKSEKKADQNQDSKEQQETEEKEDSKKQEEDEKQKESQEAEDQKEEEKQEEEKTQEEKLQEKVKEYQEKAEEAEDKYLRLLAEFNNYKKKAKQDRKEFAELANKDLMMELLPVLDDMERGQQSIEEADDVESVKEGLEFIFQKLKKTLQDKGLQEMETEGKEFDPEYHEAVSNLEVEEEEKKGKIIDEVQKGYLLNDRIIRHAKVVVGE